jgi:NAD(P)-dependent dehydrogenase (short-subunit alcohol dehydrogenase family)
MGFAGKHVVVTGGTGALGSAVVGALLARGAACTVPYVHEAEAQRFPHRGDAKVEMIAVTDLADEAEVAKVFAAVTPWASIHIAGSFAPGKVADTAKPALMAQIDSNLVSCFLCCRAAVSSMSRHDRRWNRAAAPA